MFSNRNHSNSILQIYLGVLSHRIIAVCIRAASRMMNWKIATGNHANPPGAHEAQNLPDCRMGGQRAKWTRELLFENS